jgi:hypothetical protein
MLATCSALLLVFFKGVLAKRLFCGTSRPTAGADSQMTMAENKDARPHEPTLDDV